MSKIKELKNEIKKLAQEQKELKPQRKRSFTGLRTSSDPHYQVWSNKEKLRHLHHVYNLLRNKPLPEYTKSELSQYRVEALLKIWSEEAELVH